MISNLTPFLVQPLLEFKKPEQCRIDLEKIKDRLRLYELDSGAFPSTEAGLEALIKEPYDSYHHWNGPYLDELPVDPWGRAYQYRWPGKDTEWANYDLFSFGKDGVESEDDIE